MSINSVVLDEQRNPLPINSLERTKQIIPNVTLSLSTGLGYPGASNSYYGQGNIVMTNYRLIFVSQPPLPLFDSFMVTWNKIEKGRLKHCSSWLWATITKSVRIPKFIATVHPLEDEARLVGIATIELEFQSPQDATNIEAIYSNSRWTGHLDPENSAEPPPTYPNLSSSASVLTPVPVSTSLTPMITNENEIINSPPPTYDQAINDARDNPNVLGRQPASEGASTSRTLSAARTLPA